MEISVVLPVKIQSVYYTFIQPQNWDIKVFKRSIDLLFKQQRRVATSFAGQTGIHLARRQRGSYSKSALLTSFAEINERMLVVCFLQRKNDPCFFKLL